MATPVYPPVNVTHLLINTLSAPKIVYLPAISTMNPGKMYYIKDICGNAGRSSIFLSTTGLDTFENKFRPSTLYALMSTNFQSVLLASDGVLNWMILQNYTANAISRPTTFNPTSIAGGFMWLDATAVSGSDGASITTWSSATPSYSYFMTGTATLRTGILNGLKVMQYSTSQSMSINTAITGTTFTFFFVSRQTGGTNRRVFIGNGNKLYGYWGGGKSQLYMEGWISGAGTPASDTNWDIYTITRNSSGGGNFWRYGNLLHTFGSSGGGLDSFFINTGGCCGGETSDAQVAEIVLYTATLTDTQCRQVEGYLAWKWGLQGNLPSGHLYKNAAP